MNLAHDGRATQTANNILTRILHIVITVLVSSKITIYIHISKFCARKFGDWEGIRFCGIVGGGEAGVLLEVAAEE